MIETRVDSHVTEVILTKKTEPWIKDKKYFRVCDLRRY